MLGTLGAGSRLTPHTAPRNAPPQKVTAQFNSLRAACRKGGVQVRVCARTRWGGAALCPASYTQHVCTCCAHAQAGPHLSAPAAAAAAAQYDLKHIPHP